MKVIDHGFSPNLSAIIADSKQKHIVMDWPARMRRCWQTDLILSNFSNTGKWGTLSQFYQNL